MTLCYDKEPLLRLCPKSRNESKAINPYPGAETSNRFRPPGPPTCLEALLPLGFWGFLEKPVESRVFAGNRVGIPEVVTTHTKLGGFLC